jgi:hypothetical protein
MTLFVITLYGPNDRADSFFYIGNCLAGLQGRISNTFPI